MLETTYQAKSTSSYIAVLASDLAKIAHNAHLDVLAHLLSMTQMEAEILSGKLSDRKQVP